mmetsp:Transcript_4524/g.5600  ORF Transcript_4524/g.5600 Transcript_4524/m.5600 type:complete len:100 (-) Transcript_4524:659-958(-)
MLGALMGEGLLRKNLLMVLVLKKSVSVSVVGVLLPTLLVEEFATVVTSSLAFTLRLRLVATTATTSATSTATVALDLLAFILILRIDAVRKAVSTTTTA